MKKVADLIWFRLPKSADFFVDLYREDARLKTKIYLYGDSLKKLKKKPSDFNFGGTLSKGLFVSNIISSDFSIFYNSILSQVSGKKSIVNYP